MGLPGIPGSCVVLERPESYELGPCTGENWEAQGFSEALTPTEMALTVRFDHQVLHKECPAALGGVQAWEVPGGKAVQWAESSSQVWAKPSGTSVLQGCGTLRRKCQGW